MSLRPWPLALLFVVASVASDDITIAEIISRPQINSVVRGGWLAHTNQPYELFRQQLAFGVAFGVTNPEDGIDGNQAELARSLSEIRQIARETTFGGRTQLSVEPSGDGYIGIRFLADDGPHFGWLHLATDHDRGLILRAAAFESVPGRPIVSGVVPEASGLLTGALALATLVWIGIRRGP